MAVVKTLSAKAQELECVTKDTEEEFDVNARHIWRDQDQKGFGSVLEEMLELGNKQSMLLSLERGSNTCPSSTLMRRVQLKMYVGVLVLSRLYQMELHLNG